MVSKIPNDIFQFSLPSAVSSGLNQPGPQISDLTNYGDHGLGILSNDAGYLLYIDSVAWHIAYTASQTSTTTSEGDSVTAAAGDSSSSSGSGSSKSAHTTTTTTTIKVQKAEEAKLPFIQVTKFAPEFSVAVPAEIRLEHLLPIMGSGGGGKNSFLPFAVSGAFKSVTVDAGDVDSEDGKGNGGGEVVLQNVKGRMFGFMTPKWAGGVSVPGAQCGFVSDGQGESGDVVGGRVKGFVAEENALIEWAVTGRYHLGMPKGDEWETLELSG